MVGLIVILLLSASSATMDSYMGTTTSATTEDATSGAYSSLIKTNDEDKEQFLQYIDKTELSTVKKTQLKDDVLNAWDRYPDETTKEDYLLFEEVGTLIIETAQKTKTDKKEPVVEPLPKSTIKEPPTYADERYGYLLRAGSKEQAVLFEYIDNCYASEKEKQEMKDSMKDIWERYPDEITEQDYTTLSYVEKKTAEYLNDQYFSNCDSS